MRIAFFGTPAFAVPTLEALGASSHTVEIFTQPDKPVGRKAVLSMPPVKEAALRMGLPVHQFVKIRSLEGCEALRAFSPDLMAVVAFGQLFSEENLSVPPLGAINVHGSLLPLYRGASPIQQTVIDGQPQAGVTTMKLVKRMDAGDMLLSVSTPLGEDETYGQLSQRLSLLGASLFMETLSRLEAGSLTPVPQNEEDATYCKMLDKDSGKLNFSFSARRLHNLIRGTNPWPGAWAFLDTGKLKVWESRMLPAKNDCSLSPGTLYGTPKEGLFLSCLGGDLELIEVQLPGGKRMDGKTLLRGNPIAGKVLQ